MRARWTLLLALCLLLTGCSRLLERPYSSVEAHSATYRESGEADTLRVESYQELVNALLLLVGEHTTDGVVRFYGGGADDAERACAEVQLQTPIGAYLLDYITYRGETKSDFYEMNVAFGYRRTAEEQNAIVNATSTEALPVLLRTAAEEGRAALALRVAYFTTDRDGVRATVRAVYDELYPPEEPDEPTEPSEPQEKPDEAGAETDAGEPADAEPPETEEPAADGEDAETPSEPDEPPEEREIPWEVHFYPDDEHPGIIEVILNEETPDV